MDSQSRNRLIIGGLTLAAVILVISLLMTQQRSGLPIATESPLIVDGKVVTPAQQAASPLAEPASDSPLAVPSSGMGIAANFGAEPASSSASITDSTSLTTEAELLGSPITLTAKSTVTVTLVPTEPLHFGYTVVYTYPHDAGAFTQGLQYVDGVLYEGTGLNGRSSLRRVNLETGAVEQQVDLPSEYFGEGIVVIDDLIYQLTWQSNIAFLYDRESFELLDSFGYPTEGWGLTFDGHDLIMSDGSSTLYRRDPETFAEIGRIEVLDGRTPVNRLNELEYIDNAIWANIWQTDDIVVIDPDSGQVVAKIDLSGLRPLNVNADVLNGIAYDEANERVFVTGKLWPSLFEIDLVPR